VTAPYWLEDAPLARADRRFDGPVDVAVVGGGVTGCACARVLAEAGLKVRLYEARQIAGGASGRNGGFALRGGAAPYDVSVESLGRERAAAYWRRTEQAVDRIKALAGDAFVRTGSLRLAADDEEAQALHREYELLREDGFTVEWRDELDDPVKPLFAAAMFHPPDGAVQPARWVRRLAARAAEAGADLREEIRVESIDELRAEHVVVATDGYPSGLLGPLEGLIIPTRGQMIATEPLPERLFDCPHYSRHGFDYWQQREDGRILAGGFRDTALDDEFTTSEETTPAIQTSLERLVSDLVGWPVVTTHRWAGLFGFVPDFMPVVGRVPGEERLWISGGYSGHGMVLGFMCGELVANAILGREVPDLDLFDPARLLG
jgi:glycine/D-amino acid oxidase-like deaminating enzyme